MIRNGTVLTSSTEWIVWRYTQNKTRTLRIHKSRQQNPTGHYNVHLIGGLDIRPLLVLKVEGFASSEVRSTRPLRRPPPHTSCSLDWLVEVFTRLPPGAFGARGLAFAFRAAAGRRFRFFDTGFETLVSPSVDGEDRRIVRI